MEKTEKTLRQIQGINDMLRKTMIATKFRRVVFTEAFAAHPHREMILTAIRNFTAFTIGNDPHSEHDFAFVEVDNEKFFFKIDYYDETFCWASDPYVNPNCPRVLTIGLASDY